MKRPLGRSTITVKKPGKKPGKKLFRNTKMNRGRMRVGTPKKKLPGRSLTLNKLLGILETARNYDDFIFQLTSRFQKSSKGLFYIVHGDRTVGPEAPQVYVRYGQAMIAYAPHTYAEVLWTEGEETIQFQIAEEPLDHEPGTPLQGASIVSEQNGSTSAARKRGADEATKLTINAYSFTKDGGMQPVPDEALTPRQVRAMHKSDLIKNTNRFAKKGCKGCHKGTRRRNAEADNHPRRFVFDKSWQFRRPEDAGVIKAKLDSIFQRFATRNRWNKRYQWLWEQKEVVESGGRLRAEHTFETKQFISDMIRTSGRELLGELKRHPNWRRGRGAFAAAVRDKPAVDGILARYAKLDRRALRQKQDEVERWHAEMNLDHMRTRNQEAMSWILAGGDHDLEKTFRNNDLLLFNRHAIETIGPRILDMVVSDAAWERLSARDRKTRVRLSDLAVRDLAELKEIVTAPEIVARTRRRTNAFIALERMLGDRLEAQSYLSTRVLRIGAETGRRGADLLDVYRQALSRPRPSVLNDHEAAPATDQMAYRTIRRHARSFSSKWSAGERAIAAANMLSTKKSVDDIRRAEAGIPDGEWPGQRLVIASIISGMGLDYRSIKAAERTIPAADWPGTRGILAAVMAASQKSYGDILSFSEHLPKGRWDQGSGGQRIVVAALAQSFQIPLPAIQRELKRIPRGAMPDHAAILAADLAAINGP